MSTTASKPGREITLDDIADIFNHLHHEGVSTLALSRVANRAIWALQEQDMGLTPPIEWEDQILH